jgi:acetyl-CoA carboxylase biotin carboxyl carrier protein
MVGTFYRKPSADKDTYVKVGDNIENGTVLCIIEAMKLFNEIEFDGGSGKIVKILAEDSSPIEYDQPLFLIEKA